VVQITYASPNEAELIAMAESLHQNGIRRKILDRDSSTHRELTEPATTIWKLRHFVQILLGAGLKYIVLTLGSHGAVLCSANQPSLSSQFMRYEADDDFTCSRVLLGLSCT
jgi:sugar/nucleoside kinase (ribokinase family)